MYDSSRTTSDLGTAQQIILRVVPLLMDARALVQESTLRCRSMFIHDDETQFERSTLNVWNTEGDARRPGVDQS
jgi:hypothetical protein